MAGVRQEGILQVDDVGGGGGASVSIVDPIGPNLAADSVSVTLATDEAPIDISGTVNQGTPAVVANAWPTLLTDGVDIASVKSGVAGFLLDADNGLITRSITYGRTTGGDITPDVHFTYAGANGLSNSALGKINYVIQQQYAKADTISAAPDFSRIYINDSVNGRGGETALVHVRLVGGFTGTLAARATISGQHTNVNVFDIQSQEWIDATSLPTDADHTYLIPCSGMEALYINVNTLTAGSVQTYWQTGPGGNVPWKTPVTAVDLDIRNLVFATDKVDASGSIVNLSNGLAPVGGTITLTVVNSSVDITSLTDIKSLSVQLSGALSATGTVNFELFDGAIWIAHQVIIINNITRVITAASSLVIGGTSHSFTILVNPISGSQQFRVIRTAGTGGSTAVVINPSVLPVAVLPIPTVDTELPVAVFLTDATTNPTVPGVSSFGMVWNGSTWDRQPGNSISGAVVNTKTDLTPLSPTVASVGVASAVAVAAAATRKGLIVRNLSNARISLGFGNPAVLDSGVTLYPRDTFRMDEYDFDVAAVNAIASAAASNLAIQEYLT